MVVSQTNNKLNRRTRVDEIYEIKKRRDEEVNLKIIFKWSCDNGPDLRQFSLPESLLEMKGNERIASKLTPKQKRRPSCLNDGVQPEGLKRMIMHWDNIHWDGWSIRDQRRAARISMIAVVPISECPHTDSQSSTELKWLVSSKEWTSKLNLSFEHIKPRVLHRSQWLSHSRSARNAHLFPSVWLKIILNLIYNFLRSTPKNPIPKGFEVSSGESPVMLLFIQAFWMQQTHPDSPQAAWDRLWIASVKRSLCERCTLNFYWH